MTEYDYQIQYEKYEQDMCIKQFESSIEEAISLGASDRETAVRWVVDGADITQDQIEFYGNEVIEFNFNLPYGYLNNKTP
jgi:hypothetical protein